MIQIRQPAILCRLRFLQNAESSSSLLLLVERTVGGTLGDGALAATAADADAVDDIALLGLVSEAASLVGTRRAGGAVDDVQLAKLQIGALSAKFNE